MTTNLWLLQLSAESWGAETNTHTRLKILCFEVEGPFRGGFQTLQLDPDDFRRAQLVLQLSSGVYRVVLGPGPGLLWFGFEALGVGSVGRR